MNDKEPITIEAIREIITAARDSVWVITDILQRLASGKPPYLHLKDELERNVDHLALVVASTEISESGENIQDLYDAISVGRAKLAENIWIESEY